MADPSNRRLVVLSWRSEVNICFTEANRALKWEELLKGMYGGMMTP
jgi:hypothetical protein